MSRPATCALVLATLGSAAVAAAATPAPTRTFLPRSFAVFPQQQITVAFDHGLHLEAGANCETCHEKAPASTRASDLVLPKEADCETCHDIAAARAGKPTDPPATCDVCHPGFDATVHQAPRPLIFPVPNLVFPHKVHLDRKIACDRCHPAMNEVALGTRAQLPKMETCLACHDGQKAPSACTTCHLARGKGARLTLAFANTNVPLRPQAGNPFGVDHGVRFEKNHGARALLEQGLCLECHTDAECLRCHDGLGKPVTVHPNDYLVLHPLQARHDAVRCDACHRRQSFCAPCHERVGMGRDADPMFRSRNLRVHPPREIWVDRMGPRHHAVSASRDLLACVACHREETCTTCHSNVEIGGLRDQRWFNVSPHPAPLAEACKALAAANDRACLKCHTDDDLRKKGCR